MTIDAIVPCYNEAERLGRVLKVLSECPSIHKIIFVDGGSTDDSVLRAQSYSKVHVLALGKKGGKGQDVKEGLGLVESPAVFLCDADLIGLRQENILKMIKKFEQNPNGLVVGLTQKSRFATHHWIRANIFPAISGMRIVSTEDLKKVLENSLSNDYGLEPYMNYYFLKKNAPVNKVLLDGVNDIPKPGKTGHGWQPHLAEATNVILKYFSIYTNELPKDLYNSFKSFIYPTVESESHNYHPQKIRVLGSNLNFVKVGQGRPLIFIHGWANNWEGWVPMIPYLEKYFTLYLIDLPGFGDSDDLAEYSVTVASKHLDEFIKQLPQKPAAVIGLSMGSFVVAQLGELNPSVCKKLVLIGPVIRTGRRSALITKTLRYSLWILKNFSLGETTLKKIIETRLAAYAMSKYLNMYKFNRFLVDAYGMIGKKKMRKEAFTQMGISVADVDLAKVVSEIKIPTLLLYGREDKISSPETTREELLPKNNLLMCVDIAEAGHVVSLEKPAETAQAIKDFLSKPI